MGLPGDGGVAVAGAAGQLPAIDPTTVLDAPGLARAALAFALMVLLGGVLVWRFEPFVDRSIDASLERPLESIAYGVAAHVVVVFAGVYLVERLVQFTVFGVNTGGLGVLFGGVLLLLAGALGFTVVGTTVVGLAGARRHWRGLVVGALVAGSTAVVAPVLGAFVWLVVVSMGIGGPVRTWLHASAAAEA